MACKAHCGSRASRNATHTNDDLIPWHVLPAPLGLYFAATCAIVAASALCAGSCCTRTAPTAHCRWACLLPTSLATAVWRCHCMHVRSRV